MAVDPIAISFFGFGIHWYGLVYVLGFLFGYWYLLKHHKDLGVKKEVLEDMFLYFMILSVIGGRLFHVIFYEPGYYFSNILEIVRIDKGGMSIHGGFVFGIGTLWYFAKKHKINLLKLLDVLVVPLALALTFGRLANYINQELVGTVTSSKWGVVFSFHDSQTRWPSTLFESAKNMLTYQVVLYMHFFKSFAPGVIAGWFFFLYSILRFVVNFVREPEVAIWFISMGQLLSLLSAIFGLVLIFKAKSVNSK